MDKDVSNTLQDVFADVQSVPQTKPDPEPTRDDLRKQLESDRAERVRARQSMAREMRDKGISNQEGGRSSGGLPGVCGTCYSFPCVCGNRGRHGLNTPS